VFTVKVAVAGAGWSGLLLANKIRQNHNVTVFEKNRRLKAVCAWGIPTESLREIAEWQGLNVEDYILWESKQLIIDYRGKQRSVPVAGLCTFNKQFFMEKLSQNVNIKYATDFSSAKERYDLMVDATGTREGLGRLPHDLVYVTYQVRAKFDKLPFNDFYMRFPTDTNLASKYLWLFPLSDDEAFVGCGALKGEEAFQQVNQFILENNAVIIEKQAKQLRVTSPKNSRPFYCFDCLGCAKWQSCRASVCAKAFQIVGVGNSIGAISSFGEGNDTSALTAKLLTENITDLSRYEKQVLSALKWLKHDYLFYESMIQNHTVAAVYHALRNQSVYRKRLQVPLNMNTLKQML
jgi:flavin-dependent dehydrogenase